MQQILNFYHSHLDLIHALLVFIAGSGIVSILLQNVKRWLSLQSDKVIHFLLVVFSFATVAVNYLVGAASQNPKVLGPETIMLVGGATTIYRFLIKPASNLLIDANKERERKARAIASDAEVASVTVPTLSAGTALEPKQIVVAEPTPDFQA
jgi:hypothetical protein